MHDIDISNLKSKILIASPQIPANSIFFQSVLYIYRQTQEATIGVIINRPIQISAKDFLVSIGLDNRLGQHNHQLEILIGGPNEKESGFILYQDKDTLDISVSSSLNMFQDIVVGKGPDRAQVFLGYCVWESDGLLDEINHNYWLISTLKSDILFDVEYSQRWEKSLEKLGISPQEITSGYNGNC
ncbi:MAG: hypothetical protein CMF46_03505 [Legionellales bacterium]|nr:hypothetical protein [Legionellales bacterium]|tara:strand:+ start:412 stop:966 length:555 start_codon:yes stop_codon:yes gene_type:complete